MIMSYRSVTKCNKQNYFYYKHFPVFYSDFMLCNNLLYYSPRTFPMSSLIAISLVDWLFLNASCLSNIFHVFITNSKPFLLLWPEILELRSETYPVRSLNEIYFPCKYSVFREKLLNVENRREWRGLSCIVVMGEIALWFIYIFQFSITGVRIGTAAESTCL